MRSGSRWLLAGVLVAVVLAGLPLGALGDAARDAGVRLPDPRFSPSVVWTGSHVYLFGGYNGTTYPDTIVRFDPATQAVTVMGARLPTGRMGVSAVWDGRFAYVFGGVDTAAYLTQVLRYDPASDSIAVMGATLPSPRDMTSAVWDGNHAYVFGGFGGALGFSDQILRYDPATDSVAVMTAKLPSPRDITSAVWDGSHALVIGGFNFSFINEIVQYDPATDMVEVLPATLPVGRCCASAVWDGAHVYVFGGFANNHRFDSIVRYDPVSVRAGNMSARLPTGRTDTAAVWDGRHAYVLGGYDGLFLPQILRYDLAPGPPTGLAARAGPSGPVLTWDAPNSTSYGALTAYVIDRASGPDGPFARIATLGLATTYTDASAPDGLSYYRVAGIHLGRDEGPPSNVASALVVCPAALGTCVGV